MIVEYFGHSCFLIKNSNITILTDPYPPDVDKPLNYKNNLQGVNVTQTKIPILGFENIDTIFISHAHFDHNYIKAVNGKRMVIKREGKYTVHNVNIEVIKTFHDNVNGKKLGNNLMFYFKLDGRDILFTGDLGHIPDFSKNVDILLLPIGDYYTISYEDIKTLINNLKPDYIIPMHYNRNDKKFFLKTLRDFINEFSEFKRLNISGYKISDFPIGNFPFIIVWNEDIND